MCCSSGIKRDMPSSVLRFSDFPCVMCLYTMEFYEVCRCSLFLFCPFSETCYCDSSSSSSSSSWSLVSATFGPWSGLSGPRLLVAARPTIFTPLIQVSSRYHPGMVQVSSKYPTKTYILKQTGFYIHGCTIGQTAAVRTF